MRRIRSGWWVCLLLSAGLTAQPRDRLAGPIRSSRTVEIAGTHRPGLQPQSDIGPLDPSFRITQITMVFKLTDRQQAELQRLLASQQDRSSPEYHHWLTPSEYGERFGLSPNDLSRVSQWLQSRGFHIDYVPPSRNWVVFSGAAREVQSAFKTEIHRYRVEGELRFANTTDVSLPGDLAPLVLGISGLDDFEPKPASRPIRHPDFTDPAGAFPVHLLSPDDYAAIYDLKSLYASGYDGTGEKLVIPGRCDIELADVEQFRNSYGLPPNDPQIILVPGSADPGAANSSHCDEAYLDLEWAGAIARRATVIYLNGTDVVAAVRYAVDQDLAPVISFSFAGCETGTPTGALDLYRQLAQQANAEGITWIAASGDSGAAGCDPGFPVPPATKGLSVSWPSDVPEVTGVGGTQFNDAGGTYWSDANSPTGGSALGYIPEIGWNETALQNGLASSGGGLSSYFAEPSWQSALAIPSLVARAVPDVSLTAAGHDGYLVFSSGGVGVFEGTSAATPSFAGIIALLNQYQVVNGFQAQAGMGNINPHLYSLFQSTPSAFHDITAGNNIVPCTSTPDCINGQLGYSAGPGYDMVTGLGSVDANNLITLWNGESIKLLHDLTSNAPGVVNGSCVIPPSVSTFSTSVPQFWLYFDVNGTQAGDTVQTNVYRPDGVLYTSLNSSVTTPGVNGYQCFSDSIPVSGKPAASYPGAWTIQTLWNQSTTPLFSLNFRLVGPPPTINSLSPSSAAAGGASFVLTVSGTNFSPGAVVQWNGSSLPTTVVSTGVVTASVPSDLIAMVAPVGVSVFSGGQTSNSLAFTILPASISSLAIRNQRVTTQAPPTSGCSVPTALTSFTTTSGLVYLYFDATVKTSDLLSNDWLAPDGSVVNQSFWQQAAGAYCFDNAPPLDVSALPPTRLGNWQARVFDNGQLVFSLPFTVMQSGSLAQVTSDGGWDFTLSAINLGSSPAQANFSFFDNNGNPLALPFTAGSPSASTITQTLNSNAQLLMESSGSTSATALAGWGQLLTNGGVNGFGIFSNPGLGWNAVVPLETRNAGSYILAFDNTGALATGLAIANITTQPANVNVVIRDDSGAQIGAAIISLTAQGHASFMLNQQYAMTAGRRGTVEFDTPPGGQISVLGLRANGPALTTLPVLANVSVGGGSLAHATYNGGFTSTFYLVNTGTSSAEFTLNFFDESGNPLIVPLALPQTGGATTTSALSSTLAAGAMLVVQTQAQDALPSVVGSAQLSTAGAISGFEIFRWTTFGQEASVPLETRTPNSFVLVFDNTNSRTTGVALANRTNSPAKIAVLLRNTEGSLVQTATVNLSPLGHASFMLPAAFTGVANLRGMAEFVVPSGGNISVIGLRAKSDGTLTTIPVLTK